MYSIHVDSPSSFQSGSLWGLNLSHESVDFLSYKVSSFFELKSYWNNLKPHPFKQFFSSTVNSWFKKDLNLQIHIHKAFLSDNQLLESVKVVWTHTQVIFESVYKSFLNQTTLYLRKEKMKFLKSRVACTVLLEILLVNFSSVKL